MSVKNNYRKPALVLLMAGTIGLAGCASTPGYENTQRGAVLGTLGGAAAGAVIGNQSGNPRTGAAIGAAVGALAGAGYGRYLDNQQRELEARLASERAANEVAVQRVNQGRALNVRMSSTTFFRFGTAQLVGDGQRVLNDVADVLNQYPESRVNITGYTDSVGNEGYNQQLSQQRAQAVMSYLASRGVDTSRMSATGMGEANPVATNGTEAGRQLNRRVEILIQPTTA